jgi:GR25 family glycosyltransferase involved in LPS biosynthesis
MKLPPIFCIWNREIPRREITEAHFNNSGIRATFFEGIYGKGFKVGAAEPHSKKPDGTDWYISQGHVGLCLSHYMVWSHIWHCGVEEAIVLEDDAYFSPTFHQEFHMAHKNLPNDWQMCYLGWLHRGHDRDKEKVRENIYKINQGCPFGTHAILIRRDGIRILLDTQRVMRDHIDINIWKRSLPHIRTYYVFPSIVAQRSQNGKKQKPKEFRPTV